MLPHSVDVDHVAYEFLIHALDFNRIEDRTGELCSTAF